jgi:hypothetical protein
MPPKETNNSGKPRDIGDPVQSRPERTPGRVGEPTGLQIGTP